jgi:hypothetical protein
MADTISVKIGADVIPGIPKDLSVEDIKASLSDLRPEVANYDHRYNEDKTVLEFVPRPANKG